MERNLYINGYRGIAIVAVILNHLYPNTFPNGYFGVDLFFFISGFSITAMLLSGNKVLNLNSILEFYKNRIKKLSPILIISIIFFTFLYLLIENDNIIFIFKNAVYGIFGVHNIFMYKIDYNYFNSDTNNPFLHLWSIAVEYQLYLIYPIILYLVSRNKKSFTPAIIIIALISIINYGVNYSNTDYNFYLTQSRGFEFLSGGILFFVKDKLNKKYLINSSLPSFFIFILLLLVIFSSVPLNQNFRIIIITLFFSQLILAKNNKNLVKVILENQYVKIVSIISYPLYIIHLPILFFFKKTIGLTWISQIIYLISILLIANILLKIQNYFLVNKFKITLYYIIFLLLLLVIGYFYSTPKNYFYTGQLGKKNSANEYLSSEDRQLLKNVQDKCLLTPQHVGLPSKNIDRIFIENCIKGSGRNRKIILIGDSFSTTFAPMIYTYAKNNNYDFKLLYGYGCPYPLNQDNIKYSNNKKCYVDANLLQNIIFSNLQNGDILILRNFWNKEQYLKNQSYADLNNSLDIEFKLISKAATLHGAKLLVLGANSESYSPNICDNKQWFNKFQQQECSVFNVKNKKGMSTNLLIDEYFESASNKLNFSYLNINNLLCNGSKTNCTNEIGGASIYSDKQHLNVHSYEIIYPFLSKSISNLTN